MGKKQVVFDSNVLISALGWGGKPKKCFNLLLEDRLLNFTSEDLIEELMRVMEYPKFGFSQRERERFLKILTAKSIFVNPKREVNLIEEDKADNKVLECALEAEVDYIISGDSHLLDLRNFQEISILTPDHFLNRIR